MPNPVSMLSLSTAVPPHALCQRDLAERAETVFARSFARNPHLRGVFANAGIERRYSVRPIDWYERHRGWSERTQAYLEGAQALLLAAATDAFDRARLTARDVDIVVTVSSTGVATPSLEARMARKLGLRPDVVRVPVFGLGCAGGVSGLALAARLARAQPGKIVLLMVVELCTLAFRSDRGSNADVVATALFGDGAAAALLRAGHGQAPVLQMTHAAEHMWPGTLDIMGWSVDPLGFGVVLSQALPGFLQKKLAAPASAFLEHAGIARERVRFVIHPGGAKVLAAVESALQIESGALTVERDVLRGHGNMSAPTVLFVLHEALRRGLAGKAVLAALGPGFTASFLACEVGLG